LYFSVRNGFLIAYKNERFMLPYANADALSPSTFRDENAPTSKNLPSYTVKTLRTSTDEALLALLSGGCEQTFQLTYDKHRLQIYKVAMRYLKSEVLADEVVQEVFIKLWTERSKIKPGTPIEAWLCTVAKNNTINRLKRKANEWKAINYLKVNQAQSDNTAANKLKEGDCRRLLNEAISRLSENQRKVYQLAREEDLSYSQIAVQLHISPLTVKTHMSRAMAHLKLFFAGY